jgi:hypothetical protein
MTLIYSMVFTSKGCVGLEFLEESGLEVYHTVVEYLSSTYEALGSIASNTHTHT